MNQNTKVILTGIVAAVIVLSAVVYTKADGGRLFGNATKSASDEVSGLPVGEYSTSEEDMLGAMPGNEINDPCIITNGSKECSVTVAMQSATTSTFCSIQNPANATSTILAVGTGMREEMPQAQTYDISTTTAAFKYGSTTPALVFAHSIGAGVKDSIAWSPNMATSTEKFASAPIVVNGKEGVYNARHFADGRHPFILGPTEYVTWRIATSSPSANYTTFAGTCTLKVQKL